MSIKAMPVWKWALLLLASFALSFVMYALAQTALGTVRIHWIGCLISVALATGMIALYALFVKLFEKHAAEDIPIRKCAADCLKGLGIGFGFFVVVVLFMCAFGLYHIDGFITENYSGILLSFLVFLMVATGEEILFRGVLFRWIDEKWGFPAALIVSSVLFGLMHIFQPEATWWSTLAIAIEAGLLLGAAYKFSGTLWLPIGIHWAWNFTQGNIFGFAVSGGDAGVSLIRSTVTGPDILTGGAFGAEASLEVVVIGLILSAILIFRCKSAGKCSGEGRRS